MSALFEVERWNKTRDYKMGHKYKISLVPLIDLASASRRYLRAKARSAELCSKVTKLLPVLTHVKAALERPQRKLTELLPGC